jgi:hypothetical protein
MKLSPDTLIAPEKLTKYLLVFQTKDDKSLWLAEADYHLDNWQQLLYDLRNQLLPLEAEWVEETHFGSMYEIRGLLTGPNGRILMVRSFWMQETETGVTKFITLFPDKELI